MSDILSTEEGRKLLLLGNEAIVRGALEAGVAYVSTYPGTPSSEIGDTFYQIEQNAGIYFEYSTNEKVALEFAMGTAFAGSRSLCAMKHVGLNVAADALNTLAYSGVVGGMVIVTADDPGCHSSQNEQDNRYFGLLANLPVFEPSSPAEALEMTRLAFDLSETIELPILLRTTTRISHMRAPITLGPLKNAVRSKEIIIDPARFVCIPAHARPNHLRLLKQMELAARKSETSSFNRTFGNSDAILGIITSGISFNYVHDVVAELNLTDQIEVLKIGFSHPFPMKKTLDFLKNKTRVLVVEELEPLIEKEVQIILYENELHAKVSGKNDGLFPSYGEFNPDLVQRAVEELVHGKIISQPYQINIPSPPIRPPTLCAGCPHRASYFAVLAVTGGRGVYQMDIGCYTLGVLPPLSTAHHMVDMGSSINTAAAMSHETDLPVFAFIGDSTFYHSGVPGLINAVHNRHKFILVILDNSTTAMTGHQPHPGSSKLLMHKNEKRISHETLIKGCGVKKFKIVDPNNLRETIAAFRWAMKQDEVVVIIARAPCALLKGIPQKRMAKAYRVNQEVCQKCGAHHTGTPCLETQDRWQVLQRSTQSIYRNGPYYFEHWSLPSEMRYAPCTTACPAGLCVQGYMTHTRSGNFRKALELIREHIPFPSICGYVCDRPCESACVRRKIDESLAIRSIKHFLADYDDDADENHYLVKKAKEIKKTGKKIAIIGAGPAGLTAAHDLILRGYNVVIFDRAQKPGGIMTSLIPEFRLPADVVAKEIRVIELMGARIQTGVEFGSEITLEDLQQEYDAVLIAIGAGSSAKLGIEKEASEHFLDAFLFLQNGNNRKKLELSKKRVAIIGGGNAAMDCARVAHRAGASVSVIYRRTREQMPAAGDEINRAQVEGIEFHFLLAPKTITKDGEGTILDLQVMKLGDKDSSGRPRPVPVEGETKELQVDYIIPAVGQIGENMTLEILGKCGLSGNRLSVNETTLETPLDGVFAAGDAVSGPSSIIWAIAHGKRAAWGIDKKLRDNQEDVKPLDLPAQKNVRWEPPYSDTVPPLRRVFGKQHKTGDWREYTAEQAMKEAQRCLSCGMCGHCRNCVSNFACPAIYDKDGQIGIDPLLCIGCGVCAQLCPNGAIEPIGDNML